MTDATKLELPWHLGTGYRIAKNHAICAGPIIIAIVKGGGYPAGQGWSPCTEEVAQFIVQACNGYHATQTVNEKLYALFAVLANCERIDESGEPNSLSLAEVQKLGTKGLDLIDEVSP